MTEFVDNIDFSGIADVDYEETWHADTFKSVAQGGSAQAGRCGTAVQGHAGDTARLGDVRSEPVAKRERGR